MKNLRFIFRMFRRNPLLVFVNLPGLAIGLSAVLLLSVYLKHELSYDQHFQTKNNVLRLYNAVSEEGNTTNYGICLRDAYTEIPSRVPEIRSATQIYRGWGITAEYEKQKFPNLQLLFADKDFFDVFGLELIQGNSSDALQGENNAVITRSTALKIFNRIDCVGEVLNVSEQPATVTGVINDLPNNTHFNFDVLSSMQTVHPENWGGLELYTYFRINDNADLDVVGEKIAAANNEIMKPWGEPFNLTVESGTELLADLHLHTVVDFDLSPKANLTHVFVIAGIAFLVMLIAMVNYINLYVLHGEKRIAEIGSRKSLGATQGTLSRLFFTETTVIGVLAFVLAIGLTALVQPSFAHLMQSQIELSDMFSFSGILLVLAILAVLILVSGAYPSYYLSKINLVNALKGKSTKVKRKSTMSRIAVISQFSISVFLISALVIVFAQVNYLKEVPLGFNPENVIGITNLNNEVRKSASSIVDELSQLAFVEDAACSDHGMGQGSSGQGIKKYGAPGNFKGIDEYRVQPGFAKTMQLELVDGRYFNQSEADKSAVILNQAAAKMLGPDVKVGSLVDMFDEPLTVIAIAKDFYYIDHPGALIGPLVLTNYRNNVNNLYMRTKAGTTSAQLAQIDAVLKSYSPELIISKFQLTDVYANKYTNEERMIKLVTTGAGLAIIISFIGLMALSVLNVNRRRKEIGIRKVIGSTESQVVSELLKETFMLVLIAIAIAFVGSYFTMSQWLQHFVNRVSISPVYFLLSAAFALLIAFMAVGWQSWRAATRNPVEALRYE
ncbi:FtsX-like permease family protein [uncultured Draconibacterium sp.]|uniref:FtsX-like permease family protein n=1 Tax=uncultured Draconibacterium sp. TaxID=1573823 RepID=UPI0029C7F29C|nr:FtsX-like permease family protein [uncultured Draconibacterium sp.]